MVNHERSNHGDQHGRQPAPIGRQLPSDMEELDTFTLALLRRAAGYTDPANLHDLDDLDDEDRQLLTSISGWLPDLPAALSVDVALEEDAAATPEPVRSDDPIAQMLGLVVDAAIALDGRKLAALRKGAGLDLAQFTRRLHQRGWDITIRTASGWERNRNNPPPALINAMAEELGVPTDRLLASPTARASELDVIFDDARIAAFLDSWAAEANVSAKDLRRHSMRLFETAGQRNATAATPETVLAILRHFKHLPGFASNP